MDIQYLLEKLVSLYVGSEAFVKLVMVNGELTDLYDDPSVASETCQLVDHHTLGK